MRRLLFGDIFMTTFDRRNGEENCRSPDIGRNHISPGGARNVGRKPIYIAGTHIFSSNNVKEHRENDKNFYCKTLSLEKKIY